MEDKFFKDKAAQVYRELIEATTDENHITHESIDKILYMAFKDVAKEQRYTCVDAVRAVYINHDMPVDNYILSTIQNS